MLGLWFDTSNGFGLSFSFDGFQLNWNHDISEVLNSLIKNGLEIKSLDEFDYSLYNCFNKTVEFELKKYRIEHLFF